MQGLSSTLPLAIYIYHHNIMCYDDSFKSVPSCDENQNHDLLQVDRHSLIEREGGPEIDYDVDDVDEVPDEFEDR